MIAAQRRPIEDRPSLWLAPLFLLLAVLYLYPLIDVTRLSLTDATDAATPAHYTFASYRNVLGSSGVPADDARDRACSSPPASPASWCSAC